MPGLTGLGITAAFNARNLTITTPLSADTHHADIACNAQSLGAMPSEAIAARRSIVAIGRISSC
jgi:hypothetical protein